MHLTFQSQLTPADLEEWLAHNGKAIATCPSLKPRGKESSRFSRSLLGWILILSIAVLLFVVFHHDAPAPAAPAPSPAENNNLFFSMLLNILPYILIGILLFFFYLRAISKKGRAKTIWEKFHDFHQPRNIEVSDDGLVIVMPTVENRISWPHFVHFYETPNLFLLYNSSKAAHLIPKRDLPDAVAVEGFRQLCQAHISRMPTAFPVVLAEAPPPLQAPQGSPPSP